MRTINESTWQAIERVLIAAQNRATTLLDNKDAEGTMVLREQVMYEGFDAVQSLEVVRNGVPMEPVDAVLALKSCHELLTRAMTGVGIDLADYLKTISAADRALKREGAEAAPWTNPDGTAALPSCAEALAQLNQSNEEVTCNTFPECEMNKGNNRDEQQPSGAAIVWAFAAAFAVVIGLGLLAWWGIL